MADPMTAPPSLEAIRARIDAIDAQLLALVDERAGLAVHVAAAKAAAGDGDKFGLRPGREAQLLRTLLSKDRKAARPSLVVRIWRELIGDSLSRQGPFHLNVFGGRDPGRAVEGARLRFGAAP
ncbi:MAG TPA: chorismate mutase, partial [Phenylobacterium sp.]